MKGPPLQARDRLSQGDALAGEGHYAQAEQAYRAALALDPSLGEARANLAAVLAAMERPTEALAELDKLPAAMASWSGVIAARARALTSLGRRAEAADLYRRAAKAQPEQSLWDHNLASVLGEMEDHAQAEAAARRAMAKGSDDSWTVLGRALQGQGKLEEAEAALRRSLQGRPLDQGTHRDLADLIWQRTGSLEQAIAPLDRAIESDPRAGALYIERANMLADAGEPRRAYDSLGPILGAHDPALHSNAAVYALTWDAPRALDHAARAMRASSGDLGVAKVLVEALLANGEAGQAAHVAQQMAQHHPEDQYVWALLALAWRLLGDERYGLLYDYDAFVRPYDLEAPAGWSRMDEYLGDLRLALMALHKTVAQPLEQSLRKGTQTQTDLTRVDDPAIRAFFQILRDPIADYRAAVGEGLDPLRARNAPGETAIAGAWSVRLKPGGFHINHVHPQGWLSSAFYVEVPAAVAREDRQGWIKFGQPQRPTRPALEPEHYIQPQPGRLVLFPSFMWHGTVPFEGEEPRLTIAFDVAAPAMPR